MYYLKNGYILVWVSNRSINQDRVTWNVSKFVPEGGVARLLPKSSSAFFYIAAEAILGYVSGIARGCGWWSV
jgi:hypothetical protein